MRWLSPRLNPFAGHGICVGAAITFMDSLAHIKAVASFGMLLDEFRRGTLQAVDTLVVPSSGNTADAVAHMVALCPDDGRFYSDQIIRELDPDQGRAAGSHADRLRGARRTGTAGADGPAFCRRTCAGAMR